MSSTTKGRQVLPVKGGQKLGGGKKKETKMTVVISIGAG